MRIALQIHDYIAAQEDVEKARAVQIGETTARAPAVGCDAGFPRDFTKVAAAFAIRLIMKEMAVAVAGNKQVGKTVVVIIADGDALAEAGVPDAGSLRDVGKGAVSIVVIQPRGGAGAF